MTPFDLLYLEYRRIAEQFPGWSLNEIKNMPKYERNHWVQVVLSTTT